jgi:glutathione S-transferase
MARPSAQAKLFARRSGADETTVRADLRALPQTLDHADELIAQGTIGDEAPNAADFQIAASLRALYSFAVLRPVMEERPSTALAKRLIPASPEPPIRLPAGWLPS